MQRDASIALAGLEEELAGHVSGLLCELRNYEAADLIALIRLDRLASLRSLVEGDCDEHFKPNTMELGEHAEVVVRWDAPPKIQIGMVFRNRGVELYYRLTLEAHEAAIEIDLLRFVEPLADAACRIGYLDAALVDARCLRRP
jgi:hypothetical protein